MLRFQIMMLIGIFTTDRLKSPVWQSFCLLCCVVLCCARLTPADCLLFSTRTLSSHIREQKRVANYVVVVGWVWVWWKKSFILFIKIFVVFVVIPFLFTFTFFFYLSFLFYMSFVFKSNIKKKKEFVKGFWSFWLFFCLRHKIISLLPKFLFLCVQIWAFF